MTAGDNMAALFEDQRQITEMRICFKPITPTHTSEVSLLGRHFFFWRVRVDEIIFILYIYILENSHRHIWKTHKFESQKDKWGKMGCNHVTSRPPAGVRCAKINVIETKSESHWNEMSRSHTPLFWKHTYTYSMPFQSRLLSQPNFHRAHPQDLHSSVSPVGRAHGLWVIMEGPWTVG